jgi:hypothetical protein
LKTFQITFCRKTLHITSLYKKKNLSEWKKKKCCYFPYVDTHTHICICLLFFSVFFIVFPFYLRWFFHKITTYKLLFLLIFVFIFLFLCFPMFILFHTNIHHLYLLSFFFFLSNKAKEKLCKNISIWRILVFEEDWL